MSNEIEYEIAGAVTVVRIALAYCNAQEALSGLPQEEIVTPDRQWQACVGVASRFLADPDVMTAELCHHEWRLCQMRSSHPRYWVSAVHTSWDNLPPMDQYAERAGLAAMRQELAVLQRHAAAVETAEVDDEEAWIEHLHWDDQKQHEIDNGWREE